METEGTSVKSALEQLSSAVTSLEDAVGQRVEDSKNIEQSEIELKSMLNDRMQLAEELDEAQNRANRLNEANREVSRRLVTAMETIRAVLDRE